MTDHDSAEADRPTQGAAGAHVGVEMLDLLIRNLEVAKATYASSSGVDEAADQLTMCTLLYAVPGTLCPLLYFHLPAVEEAHVA